MSTVVTVVLRSNVYRYFFSVVVKTLTRLIVYLTILSFSSRLCLLADSTNSTVWKQINYTEKYLELAYSTSVVSSPKTCAEKCHCYSPCKSFGINTDMRCSLYDGRVWAGRNGTLESGWFYYWMLEVSCPTEKGYSLKLNGTLCYKYYGTVKLNWTDAQAKCQDDGGHLYLLDTQAKRYVLDTSIIDVPVYLGSTDEFEEGVWNWLSGETVNTLEFLPNELNNFGGIQHCLRLYNGGLDDTHCFNPFNFACEVPLF